MEKSATECGVLETIEVAGETDDCKGLDTGNNTSCALLWTLSKSEARLYITRENIKTHKVSIS